MICLRAGSFAASLSVSLSVGADQMLRSHLQPSLVFQVPKESPVAFSSFDESNVASFTGRFKVAGRFHYGYSEGARRENSRPTLDFVPDAAAARAMPFWRGHGRVKHLEIANADEFAAAVVPSSVLQRFNSGKSRSINGHMTGVFEAYRASVECNSPSYVAQFVSVEFAEPTIFSGGPVYERDC